MWSLGHSGPPKVDPAEISKVLSANLESKKPDWFFKNLKISKRAAKQIMGDALSKLTGAEGFLASRQSGTRFIGSLLLNDKERTIINYFANSPPDEVFTSSQLAGELAEVLIRNRLIERKHKSRVMDVESFIALWAIEKMHRRTALLDDGDKVELYISLYGPRAAKLLTIFGDFTIPWGETKCAMHVPVFTTNCLASDHLNPPITEWQEGSYIAIPIELIDGKLQALA
jgi:hypothetical protein